MKYERIYTMENERQNLMNAIADPEATQKIVASMYADLLRCPKATADTTIWREVNLAIRDRWGIRGLERVKNLAWKERA